MIIGGASGRGFLSDLMGNLCIFWIMFGVLFGVIWGAPGLPRGQIFFGGPFLHLTLKRKRARIDSEPIWGVALGGFGGAGGAGGASGAASQAARQPGSQPGSQAGSQPAS